MIKDLSASLVAAAAEINKKSRDTFQAEQAHIAATKKKMPGVSTPKAEPAAVPNAAKKMAEEAGGTTPKTPAEKKLAAMSGNPNKITMGDVMKGRGVKKEEVELVQEADHPLPYKGATERHNNVMSHAKKMGYNVHHNEHQSDEKSGNKGKPDVTVHYERGDKRGDIPASIEVHKGAKAHGDKALHAMIKGKASAMKEGVEQIDELSKDTLHKYKAKSSMKMVGHAMAVHDKESEGKEADAGQKEKLEKRKSGWERLKSRISLDKPFHAKEEVINEADHPLPYKGAEDRYHNVISHAKKAGYNVHHNEHETDEKSGNKGTADVTVHYERGDKRGDKPASIEVHKGSKAPGDKALHAMIKGKASAMKEGWDDMMKASKEAKGTGKFDKKEVKPGVTQYTRKSSTFDDGPGKDSDERRQDRERRKGVNEGLMATLKKISQKAVKTIGHGSDEDMKKDLQKKMGIPQTGKPSMAKQNEEVQVIDEKMTLGGGPTKIVKTSTGGSVAVSSNSGSPAPAPAAKPAAAAPAKPESALDRVRSKMKKTNEETEQIDELKISTLGSYVKKAALNMANHASKLATTPAGESDKSDMHARKVQNRQFGIKDAVKRLTKENLDTPGNSTHQCAIHVKSEQFGEGRCLTTQHAEPVDGFVEWYDVMFAEGIKRVNVADVEVLEACDHGHSTKKKAK